LRGLLIRRCQAVRCIAGSAAQEDERKETAVWVSASQKIAGLRVLKVKCHSGFWWGERTLFHGEGLDISHSVFRDGESPLKESRDVKLHDSSFEWKYPLWYTRQAEVRGGELLDTARSGIWYTHGIAMTDTLIAAPKTFRRSSDITLDHVSMPNAQETLWTCEHVAMSDVQANGDYFGMNSGTSRPSVFV
jgi:hypothetical protein